MIPHPPLLTADRRVSQAVSAMRLLGAVLALLGLPALLLAAGGRTLGMKLAISSIATIVLVEPGVWYFVGSYLVGKGAVWAIDRSMWIALVQGCAACGGVILGFSTRLPMRTMAATLAVFFIPALAAMCWHLRRARPAMRDIVSAGHGFQITELRPTDCAQDVDCVIVADGSLGPIAR